MVKVDLLQVFLDADVRDDVFHYVGYGAGAAAVPVT